MKTLSFISELLFDARYFVVPLKYHVMDYEELAERIENLIIDNGDIAVMLGKELMRYKYKPPRGRNHWLYLLWKLIQAYCRKEHPSGEEIEEFIRRLNEP